MLIWKKDLSYIKSEVSCKTGYVIHVIICIKRGNMSVYRGFPGGTIHFEHLQIKRNVGPNIHTHTCTQLLLVNKVKTWEINCCDKILSTRSDIQVNIQYNKFHYTNNKNVSAPVMGSIILNNVQRLIVPCS